MRTYQENSDDLKKLRSEINTLETQLFNLQKERLEILYLKHFPIGKHITYNKNEYEIIEYDGISNSIIGKKLTNINSSSETEYPLPEWVLDELIEEEEK